jgi:hypothetical protein
MGGRALDILVHNSIFCVPKVLIVMPAHTNSFMFANGVESDFMALCVHESASLTRNYGTCILPSQLDAWLGPTSELLTPTGLLAHL